MASIIDGLSYTEIRQMALAGELAFNKLTEAEVCDLLDQAIVQFELDESDENEAFISSCLEALDNFPKYSPELNDKKILTNIIAAQEKQSADKPHIKSLKRTFLVAAIITALLCSTVIVHASGYNIFDWFFRRTSDSLDVEVTNQSSSQQHISDDDGEIMLPLEKEYTDIDTFIVENPSIRLPEYIPDGMEFISCQVSIDTDGESYMMWFENSETNENIALNQFIYSDEQFAKTFGFEIDNEYSEQYIVNDITHYIESNYDDYSVVWFSENRSYYVGSNLSLEEIKKIINSYYGG